MNSSVTLLILLFGFVMLTYFLDSPRVIFGLSNGNVKARLFTHNSIKTNDGLIINTGDIVYLKVTC